MAKNRQKETIKTNLQRILVMSGQQLYFRNSLFITMKKHVRHPNKNK